MLPTRLELPAADARLVWLPFDVSLRASERTGPVTLAAELSQHLGAFLTLLSVWRPRPYDFRVNPDVPSGTSPPLWLGASLGLSLRTR